MSDLREGRVLKLLKGDDRYVHGYLNFKKPVLPDPFQRMGPSYGEHQVYFWPVEVSLNGRRVGVSMTPPGEQP